MNGSEYANLPGTYGTQGTPAPSNTPGARYFSTSATDASGNFWLFGGGGLDAYGMSGTLGDLWEYSAGEWTWVSGSDQIGQGGVYGTQGVPDPSNVPGARSWASSWIDASGNFWLFGGCGPGGVGRDFNDLWEYNVTSKEWTWVSGSNTTGQSGSYGALGGLAPPTYPGRGSMARVGPTRAETSGSSADLVTTASGPTIFSMICGCSARALANGPGWPGRTWPTTGGRTGLWGRLIPPHCRAERVAF